MPKYFKVAHVVLSNIFYNMDAGRGVKWDTVTWMAEW